MDDFPARIADLLETVATRVRSMTVDRVAGAAKWTAVALVLTGLGLVLTVLLIVGVFRLLGELIGVEVSYAVVGGLFIVLGMFLWSRRRPRSKDQRA